MSELLSLDDLLGGIETVSATGSDEISGCRLAVFGSRSLKDQRVLDLIDKHVKEHDAQLIVTAAEPAGVCALAQLYCKQTKIPLQVHFLQADKYARGMWEHRSDHVIANSDLILLIHDGESHGTHNKMQRARYFKKPYVYERIPIDPGLKCLV